MNKLAIIGNGGHAREVEFQIGTTLAKFVDDSFYTKGNDLLFPLSTFDPDKWEVMVAISDPKAREDIVNRMPPETRYFSFIHPTAIISEDLQIGMGSFIGAYSIITTNVTIGDHCIFNRGCQVGHDSKIGNYFSGMPGSIISGNVKIGDRVYIGTNSSVREKISICDDVTIGLNCGIYLSVESPGRYTSINQRSI